MRFITLLAVCLICASSFGQVMEWNWTPSAAHHGSVVHVRDKEGCNSTGIIVKVLPGDVQGGFLGYCLTTCHSTIQNGVQVNSEYWIKYQNGLLAKNCEVVASDEANDLAVLRVWVPVGVQPATISAAEAKSGDLLEFVALGGADKTADMRASLRRFRGVASGPTYDDRIYADCVLLPGDSGGAVFDAKGNVVGVIAGGWFWYDVEQSDGKIKKATWPARAAGSRAIRKILEGVK